MIVLIQKKLEDLNLFNTIYFKNFKVIGLKYKFLKGGGLLMVLTVYKWLVIGSYIQYNWYNTLSKNGL